MILSRISVYDLAGQHILQSSCSVKALLGFFPEGSNDDEDPLALANLIHPDDLRLVSDHFQRFTTLVPGDVITVDYRMKHASGVWHWFRSQETLLLAESDGAPLQILGILQDITPQAILPSRSSAPHAAKDTCFTFAAQPERASERVSAEPATASC